MKKSYILFAPLLLLLLFLTPAAHADSSESVRVIKEYDAQNDLVIERASGERLLVQHNRLCSSMSTERPINLIWKNDKLVQLKIAANEICKVYNYGPYSSDVEISERILSGNVFSPEHLAKIYWKKDLYEIDYSEGCKNLRYYLNDTAYVHTKGDGLNGATLYLPRNRGQCTIESAKLLEKAEKDESIIDFPLENVRYEAKNNQVFFSWDKFENDENWTPLVTYSKFQFNPEDYELNQLPKLRRTRVKNLRITRLMNGQKYFFYIAATNGKGEMSEWREYEITVEKTTTSFQNSPDPEKFEIVMEETEDAFVMKWPDKASVSRRYLIQLFVDGKREMFKIIHPEEAKFIIEKRPEWSNSSFRMTVRTIPTSVYGARFFDSIFWRKG